MKMKLIDTSDLVPHFKLTKGNTYEVSPNKHWNLLYTTRTDDGKLISLSQSRFEPIRKQSILEGCIKQSIGENKCLK